MVPAPEPARPVPLWVRSGRAIRTAATHDTTKTVGRTVVRHSLYVAGGTRIVARRAWDGRTAARYERYLRTAEAAGDLEAAAAWEERGQRFRDARHRRRMDLLHSPLDAAKGAAISTGMGIGGLVLLGVAMAVATKDPSEVITPLMAVVKFINLMVTIVRVVWGPALTLAPFLALLGLWSVGAHQKAAPQWALPA
ncbi:ATP-binding protein, partial [Streptomyces sp. J2-1]|nr:ATP-binding protein [Streptomyces corallincola]